MKTHRSIAKSLTFVVSSALLLGAAGCALEESDGDLSDVSSDDSAVVGSIKHIGTKSVYDTNGQGLTVALPSGTAAGDLLVLALHRTDDYMPLALSGWTRAAECLKQDNGYQCVKASDCVAWHSGQTNKFCDTFKYKDGSQVNGHDLAQAIFYKKASSSEPSSYSFNLNIDSTGEPAWATLTALRGAATTNPIRAWANTGCDNNAHAVFPSVNAQAGDMLLLSQSFDDAIGQSLFTAPSGATSFGYVVGNDETGFLFGKTVTASGATGTMPTQGSGPPNRGQWCKDALITVAIKPQ